MIAPAVATTLLGPAALWFIAGAYAADPARITDDNDNTEEEKTRCANKTTSLT